MEPHPLASSTARLVKEFGAPQILDVEHSIRVNKPILSGHSSPASYYIRPPSSMSADALIKWFESVPGFEGFKLTLVSIPGLDTYHQPLISSDDFAKKHFHDNQERVVRVVGKSDAAIRAISEFIDALKHPFDASVFPHHDDFLVSAYRAPTGGRSAEVRLLFKVANPTLLMKVERLVTIHLNECNQERDIIASRHATSGHAPELILTSISNVPSAATYLEALANSLPRATAEQIEEATEVARKGSGGAAIASPTHTRQWTAQTPTRAVDPNELVRKAIAILADVLKASRFGGGAETNITQAGTTLEVKFPRSIGTLWLMTSYNETKHLKELANACTAVRANPLLHEGWAAYTSYEGGTLRIKAVPTNSSPPNDWKRVPG